MKPTNLPRSMRGAVLYGPHDLRIEAAPVPETIPGEVLIEVEMVGLCGSDLHFFTGDRPLKEPVILGHEITGRIVAAGRGVAPGRLGERVVVEPNIPCGSCSRCLRGLGQICLQKQSLAITRAGGLAEFIAVPSDFAWAVPETLSLANAATIEPTAVVIHALKRAEVEPGSTLAVVGCGGVGMLLAVTALAEGYQVVVIEPNPRRREAALSAGVARALAPTNSQEARTFLEESDVRAIFECAGIPATTQLCLDVAPSGTRIILLGLATQDVSLNPLRFVRNELEIRSALIYEHPADFAATIKLVSSGKLNPGNSTLPPEPLENLPEILKAMEEGTLSAKPLILLKASSSKTR